MKFTRLKKSQTGFTLAEVLVASGIMAFLALTVFNVIASGARMDERTGVQNRLYFDGIQLIERIQRGEQGYAGIMKARGNSIAINVAGDRVDYQVDQNNPYTTTVVDDTAKAVYLDYGDGDQDTWEDNVAFLDPDTTVDGDEITLTEQVEAIGFIFQDGILTVELTLNRDVNGAPHSQTISRDIFVRN